MKPKSPYPSKMFCNSQTCELSSHCFRFLPPHSLSSNLFYSPKKSNGKNICVNHIEWDKASFSQKTILK